MRLRRRNDPDLVDDLLKRVEALERRVARQVPRSTDPKIAADPLRAKLLELMHELENTDIGTPERRRIHNRMSNVRRQIRNVEDSSRVP